MEYAGDPMTVQEQRAYVESIDPETYCRERWQDINDTGYTVRLNNGATWNALPQFNGFLSRWPAAYAFTVAWERDIAEREEEISFVTYYLEETEHAVWKRLRERLTAILEEKKRGSKI